VVVVRVQVLLPRLKDSNSRVATNTLKAIGALAQMGREDLKLHLPNLLPLIMSTLQDQGSTSKREVALHTLGVLAETTGSVMEPFLKYPSLLDMIMGEIKNEQTRSLRREAVKVLGQIGAIDPDAVRKNQLAAKRLLEHTEGERSHAEKPRLKGEISVQDISPSAEEYYPTVAFTALIRLLRDASLSSYHTRVIEGLILLFRSAGTW
jgi:serine/threonine-protein kinase mTOR